MEVRKQLDIKPGELRCPRCMGRDIVPSQPRGVMDLLLRQLGRIPRHCRSCGKRFHPHIRKVRRARLAARRK